MLLLRLDIENIKTKINKSGFAWSERNFILSQSLTSQHIFFHLAFEMNFFYVSFLFFSSLQLLTKTQRSVWQRFQTLACFIHGCGRAPEYLFYPPTMCFWDDTLPILLLPFHSSSLPLNAWMKLNYGIMPRWIAVNSLSRCSVFPSGETMKVEAKW